MKYATVTDPSLPHVLLIGDSIVRGYGERVAARMTGRAYVDMWLTPQFLSPELISSMSQLVGNGHYAVIHFNESGLHAWVPGRVPDGQYGPLMLQYVRAMKSASQGAKLIWASTTPVTVLGKPGQLDDVDRLMTERNAVCVGIMHDENIQIDDLHAVLLPHLDLAKGDRFHWQDNGYELLADSVANSIQSNLPSTTVENLAGR